MTDPSSELFAVARTVASERISTELAQTEADRIVAEEQRRLAEEQKEIDRLLSEKSDERALAFIEIMRKHRIATTELFCITPVVVGQKSHTSQGRFMDRTTNYPVYEYPVVSIGDGWVTRPLHTYRYQTSYDHYYDIFSTGIIPGLILLQDHSTRSFLSGDIMPGNMKAEQDKIYMEPPKMHLSGGHWEEIVSPEAKIKAPYASDDGLTMLATRLDILNILPDNPGT